MSRTYSHAASKSSGRIATAVVNVRMAFRYLSADCAAAVPSTETFVYALLLMYVPVIAVPGTLVLAILAATAVQTHI